jgi:hypothetical protein
MERRGSDTRDEYSSPADDELGRLVRWTVGDLIREVEPPADVWPKVLERLHSSPAKDTRAPSLRRASFPLGTFVQAVVVSVLLLAFGLGVDRSLVLPRDDSVTIATPSVRETRVFEDGTDDMLRGYMLARSQRHSSVRRGGNIQ